MVDARRTVADLKALKGKTQLSMLRYFTLEEASAPETAGIDIASVPPELVTHPRYRKVAPSVFSMTGKTHLEYGSAHEYLKYCGEMLEAGADALYCSSSLQVVEYLAQEYIPVIGHVGLVPARATWTGGYRAVGKSAEDALRVYEECRAYQDAGAIAVELEVVPVEVATAISSRLELLIWSMGSGSGCDAQYLFSEDILGENRGHIPRHAKVYRDFAGELDRLQDERVAAYREFIDDIGTGTFPEEGQVVRMDPQEHERFLDRLPG